MEGGSPPNGDSGTWLLQPPWIHYIQEVISKVPRDHRHQTGRRKEYGGSNTEGCVSGLKVPRISTTHFSLAKAQCMGVQL